MNLTSRAARRLVTTSALAATLVGGVVLPATAASAATPEPTVSVGVSTAAPAQADPQAPTPVPILTRDGTPVPAPAPARTLPGGPVPIEPRGGVDTGLGGTQRDAGHGKDVAIPVAAAGVAGLGALAGLGLRRRRVGARG